MTVARPYASGDTRPGSFAGFDRCFRVDLGKERSWLRMLAVKTDHTYPLELMKSLAFLFSFMMTKYEKPPLASIARGRLDRTLPMVW